MGQNTSLCVLGSQPQDLITPEVRECRPKGGEVGRWREDGEWSADGGLGDCCAVKIQKEFNRYRTPTVGYGPFRSESSAATQSTGSMAARPMVCSFTAHTAICAQDLPGLSGELDGI